MSATEHPPATARQATDPMRRTSHAAGILHLLTFVSVPTLALHQDVRSDA